MGAVFAAAARAPITAVIIIFELTGDYRIILPLMFAVVVATTLSNAATRDTIYTLKLRRRGIEIDEPRSSSVMKAITVAEAMETPPDPLHPDQMLDEVVTRFAQERSDSLPVVDGAERLVGTVAAVDVERPVRQRLGDGLVAAALAREAPRLSIDESLEDAVAVLSATDEDGVPVVSPDGEELIGWLTHRGLLSAYHARAGSRR